MEEEKGKKLNILEEKILQYDVTIALCYLYRAMGKGSHAGFNACIERAIGFVPEGMEIEGATLHNHHPLEREIERMKNFLSNELFQRASGDAPTIGEIVDERSQLMKQLDDLYFGVAAE